MEAIEYATKDTLQPTRRQIEMNIGHIRSDAPKVKWEAARVIGNIASQSPDEVTAAIPSLLENAGDKGTVVRWSAAYAFSEIAKSNPGIRKSLLPKIKGIVKNVYPKALRSIEK